MHAGQQRAVALYARVSTADQNCALQLDDLRRFSSQRFGRCYEYVEPHIQSSLIDQQRITNREKN
jgi:predicted site-specific integrase-resolvase